MTFVLKLSALLMCVFLIVSCVVGKPLREDRVTGAAAPAPIAAPAFERFDRNSDILEVAPPSVAKQRRYQSPRASKSSYQANINDSSKVGEYKVVLAADPLLKLGGIPGRLRVWIGIPDYEPELPLAMTRVAGTLPAVGVTAKVRLTEMTPGFTVTPDESRCMRIHPTGSEVGFTLTPKKEGTFDVTANVELYGSNDCSGASTPKASTILQVQVVVDNAAVRRDRLDKFLNVFWEKLLAFWGELLVLFFAVMLFLMRRPLKKWIGFSK